MTSGDADDADLFDGTAARHAVPEERVPDGPAPSSYGEYLDMLRSSDAATPAGRIDSPTAVTTPEADGVVIAAVGVDVGTRELVTCPECGATQQVQVSRRDAADFCERCDFPLFWVTQRVTRDRDDGATESLRRLPGTVGRTSLASVPCPHCAEPNTVRAVVCVRCELPMHPVAAPPPPPMQPPPPPPLPLEVEPERGTPWWLWVIVGVFAVTILVVVLVLTGVFD